MTISTITRTKQYNGNNSTTVFAYDFNIQADSELEVYLGTPVGAPTTIVFLALVWQAVATSPLDQPPRQEWAMYLSAV